MHYAKNKKFVNITLNNLRKNYQHFDEEAGSLIDCYTIRYLLFVYLLEKVQHLSYHLVLLRNSQDHLQFSAMALIPLVLLNALNKNSFRE